MEEQTEEKTEQTYAYEVSSESEQLLKIKKKELKELKIKAARDRTVRLANASQRRVIRDDNIDRINLRLKSIKAIMVYYNRAGKLEKSRIDILGNIKGLIDSDEELIEDIDRAIPVSQEEIEVESVDESEVSLN